jgi:[protein-PII] uridylyltransferase
MQAQESKKRHTDAAARLQAGREELISRYPKLKTPDFLEKHAAIMDEYIRQRFETSMVGPSIGMVKNPYAFIALGGYGRSEHCIHSDVDLLFLFKKTVPDEAEDLIREIVYPLWDIGLEVGYATRSLKECLSLAASDFEILTPLLDARFICGMSILYSELMEQLQKKVLAHRSNKVIKWLIETNQERHRHYGDSTYRLEPNLKEGQGGLRDYHMMLWLAHIKHALKQPRDLMYLGLLSHDEFHTLARALEFIWNVRNRLHLLRGRKCDQLHFENQLKLAQAFEFKKTNGQQPVERFLGLLHGQMDFIKQQYLMFLYELGYGADGKRRKVSAKQTPVKELVVMHDTLGFTSPTAVMAAPNLLIQIFEESLRLKIPLSAEAKRIVKEFRHLVDEQFARSVDAVKSFERILLAPAPTFNVLKEMLNTGFLGRFIPEFHTVFNRIQYDEYHLYPVDKHLLRTVQTLKNFGTDAGLRAYPLCAKIYKELKERKLLLWAGLLHDIGKSAADGDHARGGAVMARSILETKGLTPREIDSVAFLVEKHLLLIKIATRRDIHDEETAIFCARQIQNAERLKMLYLLTAADSMSTGPNAWNDWTATLLRDLFLKVLNILEKGELATRQAVKGLEIKKKRVLASAETQILEDIRRYQRLGNKDFVWNITRTGDSETRTVKICAPDQPGLFSRIAGVFTLNNIDIIDAQIFTWRNNIAVDIFEVKPPPDQLFEEERWMRAEENLKDALAGKLHLAAMLGKKISGSRRRKSPVNKRPHRIVMDNHSSSFFTIIEVFAHDFPGLLFNITDTLFRCRLDIWVAKIATKVDQVVDVFYVRDFDGEKVDTPEQVSEIKSAIEARLIKKGG